MYPAIWIFAATILIAAIYAPSLVEQEAARPSMPFNEADALVEGNLKMEISTKTTRANGAIVLEGGECGSSVLCATAPASHAVNAT